MDYKEWIASLKAGDQVAIEKYQYGKTYYSIHVVERIMTNKIIVNSMVFRKDTGLEFRGKDSNWSSARTQILEITDKIKDQVARQHYARKCDSFIRSLNPNIFDTLSLEEVTKAYEHLNEIMIIITARKSMVQLNEG